MKTNRFKFYRENVSKLHRKVGDTLRASSYFNKYPIYQEYPVSKINTNYSTNAHHFDWVVLKLNVVFEVHGEQHYKPVSFGGKMSKEETMSNFLDLTYRDKEKKKAAIEAGWTYVEIPFDAVISETNLIQMFTKAFDPTATPVLEKETKEKINKRKTKEYAKEQYKRYKKYLKDKQK